MKYFILLICLAFAGCTTTLPQGCLVEATSYKYSILAKNKLPNNYAKILIVEYSDQNVGHAYCVFSTNGKDLHCYDSNIGSIDVTGLHEPIDIAEFVTYLSGQKLTVINAYFLN